MLTKRFRSFERPRLQKLVSELTSLVNRDDESLIEYITRAEELQFNLNLVNEGLSEKMFKSILLKGLPIEFDNFVTLVTYGSEDKSLDELKRDLITFGTERRIESDRKNASESVFLTQQKRCHNCNKFGHIAKFCCSNNKPHNPQPNTSKVIQCYNCNKFGHKATECRNKKFESHARRSVRNEKQNLAKDEEYFSFFLCPVDDEGVGLVLDSGATSHMINNREMFIDIDDSFSGKVQNANKTESEICGRGTVAFLGKDSNQINRKIVLENALFIPENSHSLVSISKLGEAGADILIGPELSIIDKSGVEYPLRQEKNLFIWDFSEIDKTCKETCLMSSSLKMWHKRLGQNNFTDLSKLVEHVEGMRISDSAVDVCEICELNKAKKQPIAKDCTTRAQAVLDIVHTDILGPIIPEAVVGHKYAIGFVDSFSRYCRIYFMKSRDETLEKFQQKNYLACSSRPDIASAANFLSSFVENPGEKHWKAGKRVLSYLKGSKSKSFVFRRGDKLTLECFSDADWAGHLDHRKSTSGCCFKLSSTSAVVSWSTKVQRCVATSTAEAEMSSLVEATKEAIHLRDLLQDLSVEVQKLIEIFVDNQACIALSRQSTHYGKTKHFAIKLHFIRELVERGELEL